LAYETGGLYFTVHPNRRVGSALSRDETSNLASYMKYFFDPQVMRRYRPDYVPETKYREMLTANAAKRSLVLASQKPWITPMQRRDLRFPKRSEGELVNRLTEAQKVAAKLEPRINELYAILKEGEADRDRLTGPRWQAGYDLAMGRVLAAKVRTEAYNAMLAEAKSKKFSSDKKNTWILEPTDVSNADWPSSLLKNDAEKAQQYLTRVVKDHEGTPWAMLAKKELDIGVGWKWQEGFTPVPKPRPPNANNNAPPPSDDEKRMLKKPPPKRKLPPL
jgi:hypothetical protein